MKPMARYKAAALKVGILTLVSLALLVGLLGWLRGHLFDEGTTYTVVFRDVDGMREGAPVQFMGIRVGFIDKIEPIRQKGKRNFGVAVTFTISEEGLKVPRGSLVNIQQSGLIGEKFVEITPPLLQDQVVQSTPATKQWLLREDATAKNSVIPVKVSYQEGLLSVGRVEKVERVNVTQASDALQNLIRLSYRVTKPGALIPDFPVYKLVAAGPDNPEPYLLISTQEPRDRWPSAPHGGAYFTIENPMRLKEFLDLQVASAESLKLTNDKINALLSEETMLDIQTTLKNIKELSAQTSELISTANTLFQNMGRDLKAMVASGQDLSRHLSALSDNLNSIIGDKQLQSDLRSTVSSVSQASARINELLNDPELQATLHNLNASSQNLNELTASARETFLDPQFQQQLESSVQHLDSSMQELDALLKSLNGTTSDADVQLILEDAQQTAENLKKFSKKLKGHFILWKLLF